MSIALYRKYRPATFGEVRGQEHVTDPLRQALRNGRINHAYLFSGPRGCGKTSSARILARSLNCVDGPTPDPCGRCESCVALAPDGSGSIDVIEIDAASHGGVDDARELRERAFFAPVSSRYKVYIIDEAHMVTREGFNALLKLVEEPPPHLKFVFATTEPDKVISTIRSRTHHYPFRLIPPSALRDLMEEILTEEKVSFDPAALPLVVRAGGGSARDSLSILDQLLAGADDQGITRDAAVALLGYTDSSLLTEMVDALGGRDGAAAFELIDRMVDGGHDPRRFTADLLERVRDLVVLAAVPDALDKGLINVEPDTVEPMREQATRLGAAELTRAAEILNEGLTQMRGATAPRMLLEILCARVLLPQGGAVPTAAPGSPVAPAPPVASPAAPPMAPARPTPQAAPRPEAPTPPPRPGPDTSPEPAPPAPPAADGADWPTPARPGSARPQPAAPVTPTSPPSAAPAAPATAAAGGSGSGSADENAIRAAWPRVLEAVKARRRFTWMVLTGTGVDLHGCDGRVLQLGFPKLNDAKGFGNSGSDEVVQAALRDILGLDLRVVGVPQSAPRLGGSDGGATGTATGAGGGFIGGEAAAPPAPPAAPRPQRPIADPADGWPTEPPDFAPSEAEMMDGATSPSGASRGAPVSPARPGPDGAPSSAPASSDRSGPGEHDSAPTPSSQPAGRPTPSAPERAASTDGSRADRAASHEDEADADTQTPGVSGVNLIESELGGRVIEEIDHPR